jgi:vacuolar protein sorting-associated protein 1
VSENTKEKVPKNPLVHELRKRIDAYYKLVVRNLRDLIPRQAFNFLIIKCMKELEFEAFQFTSDVNKLKEWLNEVNVLKFSPLK